MSEAQQAAKGEDIGNVVPTAEEYVDAQQRQAQTQTLNFTTTPFVQAPPPTPPEPTPSDYGVEQYREENPQIYKPQPVPIAQPVPAVPPNYGRDEANRLIYQQEAESRPLSSVTAKIEAAEQMKLADFQAQQLLLAQQEYEQLSAQKGQYTPESWQIYETSFLAYKTDALTNVATFKSNAAALDLYSVQAASFLEGQPSERVLELQSHEQAAQIKKQLDLYNLSREPLATQNKAEHFAEVQSQDQMLQPAEQNWVDFQRTVGDLVPKPVKDIYEGVSFVGGIVPTALTVKGAELWGGAQESKIRGDNLSAAGLAMGTVALGAAVGAFDIISFPVRPDLWVKSVQGIGSLVTNPAGSLRSMGTQFAINPLFSLGYAGSQVAVMGKSGVDLYGRIKTYRNLKYAKSLPDEAFYVKDAGMYSYPEEIAPQGFETLDMGSYSPLKRTYRPNYVTESLDLDVTDWNVEALGASERTPIPEAIPETTNPATLITKGKKFEAPKTEAVTSQRIQNAEIKWLDTMSQGQYDNAQLALKTTRETSGPVIAIKPAEGIGSTVSEVVAPQTRWTQPNSRLADLVIPYSPTLLRSALVNIGFTRDVSLLSSGSFNLMRTPQTQITTPQLAQETRPTYQPPRLDLVSKTIQVSEPRLRTPTIQSEIVTPRLRTSGVVSPLIFNPMKTDTSTQPSITQITPQKYTQESRQRPLSITLQSFKPVAVQIPSTRQPPIQTQKPTWRVTPPIVPTPVVPTIAPPRVPTPTVPPMFGEGNRGFSNMVWGSRKRLGKERRKYRIGNPLKGWKPGRWRP